MSCHILCLLEQSPFANAVYFIFFDVMGVASVFCRPVTLHSASREFSLES